MALTGASGAPAQPRFEAVAIAATADNSVGFVRMEIATGQAWLSWGGGDFKAAVDSTPLPPGEYHIYASSRMTADGKLLWSLDRMESVSGRAWAAAGGGPTPLFWKELVLAK